MGIFQRLNDLGMTVAMVTHELDSRAIAAAWSSCATDSSAVMNR